MFKSGSRVFNFGKCETKACIAFASVDSFSLSQSPSGHFHLNKPTPRFQYAVKKVVYVLQRPCTKLKPLQSIDSEQIMITFVQKKTFTKLLSLHGYIIRAK